MGLTDLVPPLTRQHRMNTYSPSPGRMRFPMTLWKEYLDGRVSKLQMEGDLPIDEGETPFPWPPEPGPKP